MRTFAQVYATARGRLVRADQVSDARSTSPAPTAGRRSTLTSISVGASRRLCKPPGADNLFARRYFLLYLFPQQAASEDLKYLFWNKGLLAEPAVGASSGVADWPNGQGGKRLCTVAFSRGRSIFAGIEYRPVGRVIPISISVESGLLPTIPKRHSIAQAKTPAWTLRFMRYAKWRQVL